MIGVVSTRFTILFVGLAVWLTGVFTGSQYPALWLVVLGAVLITIGIRSKAWDKDPEEREPLLDPSKPFLEAMEEMIDKRINEMTPREFGKFQRGWQKYRARHGGEKG